jgi:hypothetical protein
VIKPGQGSAFYFILRLIYIVATNDVCKSNVIFFRGGTLVPTFWADRSVGPTTSHTLPRPLNR